MSTLKKPRVMLVIKDLQQVGGAQLNTLRLATELTRIGFQVMLMGYGNDQTIRSHLKRFNLNGELTIYPITPLSDGLGRSLSLKWPNISFIFPCLAKLYKYRRNFDVIHGPLLMESGLICAFVSILLKKPSIVKIGSAGRFGDVKRALQVAFSAPRRILFKRISKFVCLTKEIEEELKNELHLNCEQLVRIPNGVDTFCFQPVNHNFNCIIRKKLEIRADQKLALFVGRLEHKKRVEFLLKAWEKTQSIRSGIDRLLIIGDGSLRPKLDKQRDKMLYRDTVIFYGESENIAPIMQAADIFVLPSVSEGLANVILESMSSGLPVIATNTDGNAEVLKQNENSLLFNEEDIQELSDCLLNLLENHTMSKILGQNARRFVEENYNLERVVQQYSEIYDQLCDT